MIKKYNYKNIDVYQSYGTWQADYVENGKRFALCRSCSRTRKIALEEAKDSVDYLNRKRENKCEVA